MRVFLIITLIAIKLSSSAQGQSLGHVFAHDSATYKGVIKGYVAKPGVTTGMVYVNNVLKGTQESSLIRIQKDGSFSANFAMYYPEDVFVSFPGLGFKGCSFSVYLEPGKEVFQTFDPVKVDEGQIYPVSTFLGDLARINTELMQARACYHQLNYSQAEAENNPLFFEELLVKRFKSLTQLRDSAGLSEKTFQFLRLNVKLTILFDYASYVTDQQQFVPENRFVAFKAFLKSQALHDEINVTSASYKYLINRLQYSRKLVPELSDLQFLALMKRMDDEVAFTPKEKAELSQFKEKNEYIDFFNSHPQYTGEINAYFTEKSALQKIKLLQEVLGLPNGLMFDLMYSQIYSQLLEDFFTPFSENKITATKEIIENPFLVSALKLHNEEIKNKISANQMVGNAPKIEEQKKWDEILNKFKGKVMYVDFWATWCAPCRAEIEATAPLKEELMDEEIAFVYLTNPSSPKEIYANMVPAIKGNHFMLTTDEWNLISTKFKITSIPHVMLIGKDGRVINDYLPPLKNNELKEKLLTATKL